MKFRWDRILVSLTALDVAYDSVTSWRSEGPVLLAAQISFLLSVVICLILENQWPESAPRPKAVKVTIRAFVVIAIASMPVALWRHDPLRHPTDETQQVAPASLQVTPAEGAQGQTLDVTITATSFHFTDGSIPHFGPGIMVLDRHMTSETALTAHIEIVAGTATGFRRIWVFTPRQHTAMDDSPQGAFSVVAGVARK